MRARCDHDARLPASFQGLFASRKLTFLSVRGHTAISIVCVLVYAWEVEQWAHLCVRVFIPCFRPTRQRLSLTENCLYKIILHLLSHPQSSRSFSTVSLVISISFPGEPLRYPLACIYTQQSGEIKRQLSILNEDTYRDFNFWPFRWYRFSKNNRHHYDNRLTETLTTGNEYFLTLTRLT